MFACSVQIISGLDNQSKFQMFMLFSGRQVGVPRRYTNCHVKTQGFAPMHTVQKQVCQAPYENRCCNSVRLYGLVWNYDEGTFGIEGHRKLHQNALSSPSHCFL